MRRTIEITNLEGSGSIGVVSSQLPMGLDYLAFYLVDELGAVAIADVSDIKLFANTDIIRQYSGTFQNDMNQVDFLASFAADNILSIHLDMLNMKTVQATYGTTLNTLSPDPVTGNTITSARVEVTLGGAAVPRWRLFADVDDSGAGGPGFIERIRVYGNETIGTAERSFAKTLPFGTFDVRYWRRLFVANVSAGAISLGRLLRGSEQAEVFKRTAALDARILGNYGIRQLAGSISFLLDGTETGIPETFDTMVKGPNMNAKAAKMISVGNMDFRLTNSAAATCDLVLDTIGQL